jgi:hypothetical protein
LQNTKPSDPEQTLSRDDWRSLDLPALRSQQLTRLDGKLSQIADNQRQHRDHFTLGQLSQSEALQSENLTLQKEVIQAMEQKRATMGEVDRENLDFAGRYQAKVAEKAALRVQICEVEHILR